MDTVTLKKHGLSAAAAGFDESPPSSDDDLQAYLLDGVSRTFALTIPQLPESLAPVVSNAYLLCRIVDTIEDEPVLSLEQKRYFSNLFVEAVAGNEDSARFAAALAPMLSDSTIPTERELIELTPRVLDITHGFPDRQRRILHRCVRIMSEGMVEFQEPQPHTGLRDLAHMDRYCYFVAGVVGEMLTQLYATYSPAIARMEAEMMPLAVSFGQGLQMTNILKDIWDDLERGACWLPRSVFEREGFDLDRLAPGQTDAAFHRGLRYLIGVARNHLTNAVRYTRMLPPEETGIRNFCLWAIGMAVLTLRRLNHNPGFASGHEVKISRRSVRTTVATSRLTAGNNAMIGLVFRLTTAGLPSHPLEEAA